MPPPPKRTDLTGNMFAFYLFNDAVGTNVVIDETGNYDAELEGNAPPPGDYTSLLHRTDEKPANLQASFLFAVMAMGNYKWIELPSAVGSVGQEDEAFTYCIWLKPDTVARTEYVFERNDSLGNQISLKKDSGGYWRWNCWSANGVGAEVVSDEVASGDWELLMVGRRVDGTTFLYVDTVTGQGWETEAGTTNSVYSSGTFYVARDTANTARFLGYMGFMLVLDKAIVIDTDTNDEDDWLYNNGDGTEELKQPVRPKVGGANLATLVGGALCR